MDDSRLLLSDDAWGRIAVVLRAVKHPAGAPPELSDRDFVEAMLFLARTGTPWRDLPGRFGARGTVSSRFYRWRQAGVWDRVLAAVTTAYAGDVQMIDSTSVRVHQHAANSKKATRIAVWAASAAD